METSGYKDKPHFQILKSTVQYKYEPKSFSSPPFLTQLNLTRDSGTLSFLLGLPIPLLPASGSSRVRAGGKRNRKNVAKSFHLAGALLDTDASAMTED